MHDYQKALNRLRGEAEKILKQYRAPTSLDEFMRSNYEFKDRVCMAAWGVVVNCERLEQEIERGRIHHALNRLMEVCQHYEYLWIYDALRDDWREDQNKALLTVQILEALLSGRSKRNQAASIHSKEAAQARYLEIREYVTEQAKLIVSPKHGEWERLKKKAAKEFDVHPRTIERAFKGHTRPFK